MKTALETINEFYTRISWSQRGNCHFAERVLSDGFVLNFLAASSNENDYTMLLQGMESLMQLGQDYEGYLSKACEKAKNELAPYCDDEDMSGALANSLTLTYVETKPGKTIFTFTDTAGIIGGHVLNVHNDGNFEITSAFLEDQ